MIATTTTTTTTTTNDNINHDNNNYKRESDCDTNCKWRAWLSKETGENGNWRTIRDHPNYCIIEVGQNTEKSPGNQRRLVAAPQKEPQLMMV